MNDTTCRSCGAGGTPTAHFTTRAERDELRETRRTANLVLYVSHFATCPNAAQHRRRGPNA